MVQERLCQNWRSLSFSSIDMGIVLNTLIREGYVGGGACRVFYDIDSDGDFLGQRFDVADDAHASARFALKAAQQSHGA